VCGDILSKRDGTPQALNLVPACAEGKDGWRGDDDGVGEILGICCASGKERERVLNRNGKDGIRLGI